MPDLGLIYHLSLVDTTRLELFFLPTGVLEVLRAMALLYAVHRLAALSRVIDHFSGQFRPL